MKKKKIAVVGTIDESHKNISGQYDRTEIIKNGLIEQNYQVNFINMFRWKSEPISILVAICYAYFKSDVIIFMASLNGTRLLLNIFNILYLFKKRVVIQIVIGGIGNVNFAKSKRHYRNLIQKLDAVFVEVKSMVNDYNDLGINNVYYLPNCKKINLITTVINNSKMSPPFRFCTYSRIAPNKGIDDAIAATEELNRLYGNNYCTLDIYGTFLPQDEKWFKKLMTEASSAITYKGKIKRITSIDVLSKYSLMLFPTHHIGEGVPGGVIDCYEAGLPIVVHDTSYMSDIVKDGITGFVYIDDFDNGLVGAILRYTDSMNSSAKVNMRRNCQSESKLYGINNVIQDLINFIEKDNYNYTIANYCND